MIVDDLSLIKVRQRPEVPAEPERPADPVYEWEITVRRWDAAGYGDNRDFVIIAETPFRVLATDKGEVTEKVNAAFCAGRVQTRYNGPTRGSHDWTLQAAKEVRS